MRRQALRDGEFCFFHDPATVNEAASARKLGGLRRRRESTVSGAYDLEGLDDLEEARRILAIATIDTLGLENSIQRSRVLIQVAMARVRLVQHAEFEARLERLEATSQAGSPEPTVFPEASDAH